MAKRSVRKTRHRSDSTMNLSFKHKVQIGIVHAKLVRKEINYNQVPQWMRELNKSAEQEAELNASVQTEIDHVMIADRVKAVQAGEVVGLPLEEVITHLHGDSCNHE